MKMKVGGEILSVGKLPRFITIDDDKRAELKYVGKEPGDIRGNPCTWYIHRIISIRKVAL